jgi:hypothetical protein
MGVRIGNPRVGHRVGGFYVSAPITGRNVGRQIRIGRRLPGGFYGSVPVRISGSRRPQRPIGSLPLSGMIATTVVYVGLAVVILMAGAWFFALPLLIATVFCWLRWVANPQQRRPLVVREP